MMADNAFQELRVGFTAAVSHELRTPLARLLRVVVENLVTNGIRYAGDGARCTVSARREGDITLLSVADNGAGVPDEELGRLFERFYRGDRARTTRGTGLGLAIVKHIV